MGNAALIYGRTTVDLGAGGLSNALPSRAVDFARQAGGTVQTTLRNAGWYDSIDLEKVFSEATAPGLYAKLQAFWSWAARGNPFALALDSAKVANQAIASDTYSGNLLVNPYLEIWSGNPPAPTGVTLTQVGGTSMSRETQLEHVTIGLYSLRYDIYSTDQSKASFVTDRIIPISNPFAISFYWKHKPAGSAAVGYAVIDNATGNYVQSDGTWAAGVYFRSVAVPTNNIWTLESRTYSTGGGTPSTGTYQLVIRNPPTGGSGYQCWLGEVRFQLVTPRFLIGALQGIAVNDVLWVFSRTERRGEILTVSNVTDPGIGDGSRDLSFTTVPTERYTTRDIVRHDGYFPNLYSDQKDGALVEQPGGVQLYKFSLKCREGLTGRT